MSTNHYAEAIRLLDLANEISEGISDDQHGHLSIAHAPADLDALLAEVKRLTAERDEARAAHAALLADVEALRRTYRTADGWPMSLIAVDRKLAAVIAKHAPKEADRG